MTLLHNEVVYIRQVLLYTQIIHLGITTLLASNTSLLFHCQQIAESFADCLGGLLSVVGQNMTLTIEAQPNCTLGQVHYKNKPEMAADNKK